MRGGLLAVICGIRGDGLNLVTGLTRCVSVEDMFRILRKIIKIYYSEYIVEGFVWLCVLLCIYCIVYIYC